MRAKLLIVLLVIGWVSISCTSIHSASNSEVSNKEYPAINSFSVVDAKVSELVSKYGSDEVLLVSDLDNTLLAMNQNLGSVQWYDWQKTLAKDDQVKLEVGDRGRLKIQWLLYAISEMHKPETNLDNYINHIQSQKVATIVLTSRSPQARDASIRELERNGYLFNTTELVIHPKNWLSGPYCPFASGTVSRTSKQCSFNSGDQVKFDLSEDEVKAARKGVRPVTYSEGIFMTAGQHKGVMLKTLLQRADRTFKGIVFVDDAIKHVENVFHSFKDTSTEIVSFHYTKEALNVDTFNTSDKEKQKTTQEWDSLRTIFNDVFK